MASASSFPHGRSFPSPDRPSPQRKQGPCWRCGLVGKPLLSHASAKRGSTRSQTARNADLDPKELAKVLPKDKVIYAHCRAGGRCLRAAELLKKQGYGVRPLKQGFADLIEAGFPKGDK